MKNINAKLLQFGARNKFKEPTTTQQVRVKDMNLLKEELKKRGIAMTFADAFHFLLIHAFGGK